MTHRNPVAIFTSNRNLGRTFVADEFLVQLFGWFGRDRESWTDKLGQETRHTPDSHLTSFPSCDEFPVSETIFLLQYEFGYYIFKTPFLQKKNVNNCEIRQKFFFSYVIKLALQLSSFIYANVMTIMTIQLATQHPLWKYHTDALVFTNAEIAKEPASYLKD